MWIQANLDVFNQEITLVVAALSPHDLETVKSTAFNATSHDEAVTVNAFPFISGCHRMQCRVIVYSVASILNFGEVSRTLVICALKCKDRHSEYQWVCFAWLNDSATSTDKFVKQPVTKISSRNKHMSKTLGQWIVLRTALNRCEFILWWCHFPVLTCNMITSVLW